MEWGFLCRASTYRDGFIDRKAIGCGIWHVHQLELVDVFLLTFQLPNNLGNRIEALFPLSYFSFLSVFSCRMDSCCYLLLTVLLNSKSTLLNL